MNKPQVKIETFKKINGSIQIDYNGAYVGSLRPSPPWFKEDGIDTESIANLIASAPEMLETLQFCLGVLANAEMTDKDLDIKKAYSKVFHTIAKAEGK